ncbi:MAG: hydroxyethylthiazole kinase [Verrucomicrobia bacterium]|nr:hydroxyethylthiazole kinase [Verrucomicrobiota bacterium]
MINPETIWRDLSAVREKGPLVHNITNFVVMNVTANALLALGASPIMAHATGELDELLGIVSALVLNIGTLDSGWIEIMGTAAALAGKRGVPIVLDPVGAGASRLRTETSLALIQMQRPAILRANPSEILALAGASGVTKGVDSTHRPDEAEEAARSLAQKMNCAVVASGAVDFLTDGTTDVRISGGSPLMPRITGMGCTSSALVGAFAAVATSPLEAAAAGMAVMKVAAEMAAEKSSGPGTQQLYFLDALHGITKEDLVRRLKIS